MFAIAKTFRFSAAHHLPDLPEGHKCRTPHGHNYSVTLVVAADHLDDYGFVIDYGDLAPFRDFLDRVLDHGDLNDPDTAAGNWWANLSGGPAAGQPSAERLAFHLFHAAQILLEGVGIHTVVVQETPNTLAAYSPTGLPLLWTA